MYVGKCWARKNLLRSRNLRLNIKSEKTGLREPQELSGIPTLFPGSKAVFFFLMDCYLCKDVFLFFVN